MSDPLDLLRTMYPRLENGDKAAAKEVVDHIHAMQAHIADLESTLSRQPLPEAPASATVKVVDPASQMEWLLTFRFHTEDQLIESVARISGKLPALGVVGFDAYVDSRRAERAESAERQADKALPAPATQTRNQLQADALSFKAETLEKSTKGDKTYYKVKGGKFTKFGVTVWPEVLAEAGFDLDTLAGVTSMAGYTAHYILNEKGDPAKVIGLEPA